MNQEQTTHLASDPPFDAHSAGSTADRPESVPMRTFPLSALGKAFKGVGNATYRLRRLLELEVRRVHGKITIAHADAINVACKWEQVAQIADSQIARGRSHTPLADALEAARATDRRSLAVRKLGLTEAGGFGGDDWAETDAMREAGGGT